MVSAAVRSCFFNFGVAVDLDFFRLLFVEPGKFGPGFVVDAQQFIEFGRQRESVAPIGALNNVMIQTESVAIALKSNVVGRIRARGRRTIERPQRLRGAL